MRIVRDLYCGLSLAVMVGLVVSAQTPPDKPSVGSLQKPAPEIPGVIRAGTLPEVLLSGLTSSDDPIAWSEAGIVFSEPVANRVLRLDAQGKMSTLVEGLHEPLGMSIDQKGRLFSLQGMDGYTGVLTIWPRASAATIATTFNGQPFSRPNDMVLDKRGGVYLSDPGLTAGQALLVEKARGGQPLGPRLPPAVYYVPLGGNAIKVADGIARPNGVQLSRDEKTLYVNDTSGINAFAFDVQADGTLTNRRNFANYKGRGRTPAGAETTASGADGIVVDNDGRVYCITEAGVEVFTPQGQPLGIIPAICTVVGGRCQGLAFAGPEKKTLYLAGYGAVLKIDMVAQGFTGRVK